MSRVVHHDNGFHPPRPVLPALARGLQGRCPCCGESQLFAGYLARRPVCEACGEELHHAAPGSTAAMLVILAALVPALLVGWLAVVFGTGTLWSDVMLAEMVGVYAAFELMPRITGAVINLEWALRIGGFDPDFSPLTDPAAQPLGEPPVLAADVTAPAE